MQSKQTKTKWYKDTGDRWMIHVHCQNIVE